MTKRCASTGHVRWTVPVKRDDVVSGSLYEVRQLQNGRADDYDQVGGAVEQGGYNALVESTCFPIRQSRLSEYDVGVETAKEMNPNVGSR